MQEHDMPADSVPLLTAVYYDIEGISPYINVHPSIDVHDIWAFGKLLHQWAQSRQAN